MPARDRPPHPAISQSLGPYLVNCSKGQLRDHEGAEQLRGIAQLVSAALSRADVPERERRRCTMIVDEGQVFRMDGLAEILSEARRFHVAEGQGARELYRRILKSYRAVIATQNGAATVAAETKVIASILMDGRGFAQVLT